MLIKSLSHENPSVRRVSANCLAKYGPDARVALPALRAALYDDDELTRTAAMDALKRIDLDVSAKIATK